MKTRFTVPFLAAAVLWLTGLIFAQAASDPNPPALLALARQAGDLDPKKADPAIRALRAAGREGLRALSVVYAADVAAHTSGGVAKSDEHWECVRTAFDTVGLQRDDYASQLYWHTNLDEAKVAAQAEGKPILSLRLLGKLNEEYSCANSRFFRTTLYANRDVADYLRDHFILHWQSERPVPVITIDMGDGRKIERTITGNSIHYILDTRGRPVDGLPGLYGARAFLDQLTLAFNAAQEASKLDGGERARFLRDYHQARLTDIQERWSEDLSRVGAAGLPGGPDLSSKGPDGNPTANQAAILTVSKTMVEKPMLFGGVLAPPGSATDWWRLEASSNDATWERIAALHTQETELDPSALALIRSKQPSLQPAMRLSVSKAAVETPMARMVGKLTRSIAEDTVRNEYELHSRLHEWFVQGTAPASLEALNAKVYADIFLTPASDPWLGLAPDDVFSALDHGGLMQNKPNASIHP